jgi:hypothetical protein
MSAACDDLSLPPGVTIRGLTHDAALHGAAGFNPGTLLSICTDPPHHSPCGRRRADRKSPFALSLSKGAGTKVIPKGFDRLSPNGVRLSLNGVRLSLNGMRLSPSGGRRIQHL